jgi:hypothetical protein
MTLDHFIIAVYCWIAENIEACTGGKRLRGAGFPPSLPDAEALTIAVVGECLGLDSDKHIWLHFKRHYAEWFPGLRSRPAFVKQCASLLTLKHMLLERLFADARSGPLHMMDGVPMPVMHLARSSRDRCFEGEAAYGYCAAKDEHYYGFLGHVLINDEGRLAGFMFTPAGGSERAALEEMAQGLSGMILADKGLISAPLKERLAQIGVDLQTPLRDNMEDTRNPAFLRWIISTRRLVETVIGQLTERFKINAIRVKDMWHFKARVARKLLAHALATLIAKQTGNVPTQIEPMLS